MKDFLRKNALSAICLLLSTVAVICAIFYPQPKQEEEAQQRVVRVWNVDTFEGGKGSRTSFLKSAARRAEKGREKIYYLVTSYSLEGAQAAFADGLFPDILSFGIGLSLHLEKSMLLPYSFSGGEVGGECYAYPWCRGGYALFSLDENFEKEGKTAISAGGSNLVALAACMNGIEGEEMPSLNAYTKFLSGEYAYLLGTQRDLCRFRSRGVSVYYRPLPAYCDLYQYISVLNPEFLPEGQALLSELLSAPEELENIGMFPAFQGSDFAPLPEKTPVVFSSDEALKTIRDALKNGEKKIPEKFLKTV